MRLALLLATMLCALAPCRGQPAGDAASSTGSPQIRAQSPQVVHDLSTPARAPDDGGRADAAPLVARGSGVRPDWRPAPGAPPVPEPGTLLLVGTGLVGVALFARGRRRRSH